MKEKRPRIGIAVILKDGDKVLLGKRKSAHGKETWGFPGGHLEHNETIESCACREMEEETGVTITHVHFLTLTEDFFPESGKHYITIFVTGEYLKGEICVREPDKCERWEWFSWHHLPDELFLPIQNLKKRGVDPTRRD